MYTSSSDAGGVTVGVQRAVWPDLSPELAELVAPPIIVTTGPVKRPVNAHRRAQLSRSRGNMPVGRHRHTAG
ncbi:hypothetical protein ACPL_1325 [Actinoplanes sp. SE50/110]|nr:hypothetical protein ACPL_1325 [Actinoplanes sp. SE50/110]SLL98027.1 hypothetical protein ACSP50_1244 [Actinoplanes sp. SE50/110]